MSPALESGPADASRLGRCGRMRLSPRRLIFAAAGCLAILCLIGLPASLEMATAQPPEPTPADALPVPLDPADPRLLAPTPELPSLSVDEALDEIDAGSQQQVVIPLSDAVRRRIEDALNQPTTDGQGRLLPRASTGDPILDDVLDVIRRRGSVTDGSSLDLRNDLAPLDTDRQYAETERVPSQGAESWSDRRSLPFRDSLGDSAADSIGAVSPDARYDAAEALLRAARKLSAVPGGDASTARLIASMRERAAMLMLDQFAPEAIDFD